jgi:hypothetical protein
MLGSPVECLLIAQKAATGDPVSPLSHTCLSCSPSPPDDSRVPFLASNAHPKSMPASIKEHDEIRVEGRATYIVWT